MKYICYILLISIFWACSPSSSSQQPTANSQQPNIIYLIADDLGYGDLSANGQTKFQTPNLDRMAAEGMKLTRHYAGSTVCAPSRSVLMTGLHTGHTFVRGNKEVKPEGQYPLADAIKTLPEFMKDAGYATGGFGKWGLGPPASEGDPVNQGIDQYFGYNCQRLAHNYYPEYLWDNFEKVILEGNANGGTGEYAHDLIHARALDFIEQHKDTAFFLFLPYTIPHAELLVPEDSIFEHFKGQYPETPYEGVDDGPRYRLGPYGSQEYPHAAFAAMVTRLDMAVGDILDKLQDLGLDDNTLFIFTSDNGPHKEGGADPDFFNSNAGLKGYKRDLYEGGIRVPTLARWPGKIAAGSSSDHHSAFWDVLPTCLELANKPAPQDLDGISFLPTLLGEAQQTKHDYLYWEFHEQGGKQAVLKGKWKAIRLNVQKDPNGPLELYDLETDEQEMNNIADQYPEVVAEMAAIMKEAHTPSEAFAFDWE